MEATAEIKPIEPETGNAGVGKKMKEIFVTPLFIVCSPHRHTQNGSVEMLQKGIPVCLRKT